MTLCRTGVCVCVCVTVRSSGSISRVLRACVLKPAGVSSSSVLILGGGGVCRVQASAMGAELQRDNRLHGLRTSQEDGAASPLKWVTGENVPIWQSPKGRFNLGS